MKKKLKIPIGKILTLLPSVIPLLKKKKHNLWYQRLDGKWVKKAGPFSKRQCRRQQRELMRLGADPDRFSILRVGVEPPK